MPPSTVKMSASSTTTIVLRATPPIALAISKAATRSRRFGSPLASLVSPQSRPITSLAELQAQFAARTAELEGQEEIPRPSHWGGYELRATAVELWIADPVRLHECIRYERLGAEWKGARRAP